MDPYVRKEPATNLDKVLYTAKVHTTGGRDGASRSSMAAWTSSCRLPASPATAPIRSSFSPPVGRPVSSVRLRMWPPKEKIALPADPAIDAEVDLGTNGGGYLLRARLNISLPGLDREVARTLVDAAHDHTCPYSKATRGNIDVVINLV